MKAADQLNEGLSTEFTSRISSILIECSQQMILHTSSPISPVNVMNVREQSLSITGRGVEGI